ncbi:MAG: hypothetical protein H7222_10690 [Methylotenera sp.]|nr:hypothetical protein [Oligoflexia bacterium]
MSRNIELQNAQTIQRLIDHGFYQNHLEVVRDALVLLVEHQNEMISDPYSEQLPLFLEVEDDDE